MSSDVPSSSTSVTILTGTDLPNVFLLLYSAIPISASVSRFRGQMVKSMRKFPVVLSRSVTRAALMLRVRTVIVALHMSLVEPIKINYVAPKCMISYVIIYF